MSFPYMVTFIKLDDTGSDQKEIRVVAPTALAAAQVAMRQLIVGFTSVFEKGWECTDVEFLKEPGGTNEQG